MALMRASRIARPLMIPSKMSYRLFAQHTASRSLDRRRTARQIQQRFQSTSTGQHPTPSQSPPSLPSRFLSTLAKYATIATLSCTAGIFYASYYHPNLPALLSILKSSTKPTTPADTLSPDSYIPPNEAIAAINTHILTSPLAASLRTHAHQYTEWRPHLQILSSLRPTNLTGGTLLGPGRIAVPPLFFNDKHGKNMVALFYLGDQLCGHPGIVHGGLLATLLDEGLARCCFPALPNKVGVTASLKVDYRRPARAERYYVLRAETVKVEGRKAWVKGWIEEMGDTSGEGGGAVRLVEAEALYIEPRNHKWLKKLYSVAMPDQSREK